MQWGGSKHKGKALLFFLLLLWFFNPIFTKYNEPSILFNFLEIRLTLR
jgi:hypothetical protein